MLRRMYILLTRPKQAIGEFRAGDYLTPFLFFLFFAIVTGFLRNLAFVLSMVIFTLFHPSEIGRPAPPGLSDVFGIFSGSTSFLTFGKRPGVPGRFFCQFLEERVGINDKCADSF